MSSEFGPIKCEQIVTRSLIIFSWWITIIDVVATSYPFNIFEGILSSRSGLIMPGSPTLTTLRLLLLGCLFLHFVIYLCFKLFNLLIKFIYIQLYIFQWCFCLHHIHWQHFYWIVISPTLIHFVPSFCNYCRHSFRGSRPIRATATISPSLI